MTHKTFAALAVGFVVLAYFALQPRGERATPSTDETPASDASDADRLEPLPETSEWPAEASMDEASAAQEEDMAVKLVETLHADSSLTDVAIIQSVECSDSRCTVELEARSGKDVQASMLKFLQRHPEYGSSFKVAQGDNPRVTQFIIGKEKL